MKARKENEDWVISLRTFLRDEFGSSWQVKEKRGATNLRIRLESGERIYRNLGLKWNKANSSKIRESVTEIRDLVMEKKVPIDEAIQRVKSNQTDEPLPKGNTENKKILDAWKKYGLYLIEFEGVKESTWQKEYQAKQAWRLEEIGAVANSKELFSKLVKVRNLCEGPRKGMTQATGSDARRRTLNYVKRFLIWATGSESNYLLPQELAPPENIDVFIGKKKSDQKAKDKKRKLLPTLTDEQIEELLDSLPVEDENPIIQAKARMWKFCLQLCVAYGLRPAEACNTFLSVRGKIKKYIWCSYSKTTTKGDSPMGRLWCLDDREERWDLIKQIEEGMPLPDLVEERVDHEGSKYYVSKAGDKFQDFLVNYSPVWNRLKLEKLKNGIVLKPYAFRHSFSKKGHQELRLSDQEMAYMMRHSVETHHRSYSDFIDDAEMEKALEKSLEAQLEDEIFRRGKYKTK